MVIGVEKVAVSETRYSECNDENEDLFVAEFVKRPSCGRRSKNELILLTQVITVYTISSNKEFINVHVPFPS